MQTMSIKDTRNNLATIVETVAITKEKYLITKFGKPKAIIVPIEDIDNSTKNRVKALDETFGMWKDRKNDLQRKNTRYEKIFN